MWKRSNEEITSRTFHNFFLWRDGEGMPWRSPTKETIILLFAIVTHQFESSAPSMSGKHSGIYNLSYGMEGNGVIWNVYLHCAVPKNIHTPPPQKGLEIPGGGGISRGVGVSYYIKKIPFVGEVWTYYGTTQ